MPTSPAAKQQLPGRTGEREVEWQLACTDLGSVRRWLSDHGTIDGLVLEPRSTQQIFDTYLDTDDWRIHRAGFALRVRSGSGTTEATLKSLHSASTEVADRRELTETLNGSDQEAIRASTGPVGTRVCAVSGARTLLPLFELRTSRQRFAIRKTDEARQLGEIALDETVISRPHGAPQANMLRVEVEALTQSHAPLRSLVKTLRSNCALEAASDSKYSLGLKSVGLAPPAPEFAATSVAASMTMVEVALANLRRYLAAWQLREPGARLGDDPEELHELRVAGRRLDAILRQFQSFLPPASFKDPRDAKDRVECLRRGPRSRRRLGRVANLQSQIAEIGSQRRSALEGILIDGARPGPCANVERSRLDLGAEEFRGIILAAAAPWRCIASLSGRAGAGSFAQIATADVSASCASVRICSGRIPPPRSITRFADK